MFQRFKIRSRLPPTRVGWSFAVLFDPKKSSRTFDDSRQHYDVYQWKLWYLRFDLTFIKIWFFRSTITKDWLWYFAVWFNVYQYLNLVFCGFLGLIRILRISDTHTVVTRAFLEVIFQRGNDISFGDKRRKRAMLFVMIPCCWWRCVRAFSWFSQTCFNTITKALKTNTSDRTNGGSTRRRKRWKRAAAKQDGTSEEKETAMQIKQLLS